DRPLGLDRRTRGCGVGRAAARGAAGGAARADLPVRPARGPPPGCGRRPRGILAGPAAAAPRAAARRPVDRAGAARPGRIHRVPRHRDWGAAGLGTCREIHVTVPDTLDLYGTLSR